MEKKQYRHRIGIVYANRRILTVLLDNLGRDVGGGGAADDDVDDIGDCIIIL